MFSDSDTCIPDSELPTSNINNAFADDLSSILENTYSESLHKTFKNKNSYNNNLCKNKKTEKQCFNVSSNDISSNDVSSNVISIDEIKKDMSHVLQIVNNSVLKMNNSIADLNLKLNKLSEDVDSIKNINVSETPQIIDIVKVHIDDHLNKRFDYFIDVVDKRINFLIKQQK